MTEHTIFMNTRVLDAYGCVKDSAEGGKEEPAMFCKFHGPHFSYIVFRDVAWHFGTRLLLFPSTAKEMKTGQRLTRKNIKSFCRSPFAATVQKQNSLAGSLSAAYQVPGMCQHTYRTKSATSTNYRHTHR